MSLYQQLKDSKRVVSFGCSMIYGDELPDWDFHIPSKLVAPSLMANEFNLDYKTYSMQGLGNDAISKRIGMYLLNDHQPGDFLFIGWSSLFRKELFVPEMKQTINCIPNFYSLENFTHLDQPMIDDVTRVYQYYHDIIETVELDNLVNDYAQYVNILYHALENLKIPFIMVKMLSEYKEISEDLKKILNNHPNFYLENESMMQYLSEFKEKSTLFYPGKHPNEEGQRRIAALLLDYVHHV